MEDYERKQLLIAGKKKFKKFRSKKIESSNINNNKLLEKEKNRIKNKIKSPIERPVSLSKNLENDSSSSIEDITNSDIKNEPIFNNNENVLTNNNNHVGNNIKVDEEIILENNIQETNY